MHNSASTAATANIGQRVGLGILAVFLGQGITIFGQLAVVPLFLWAWGAERYGEWLALYAAVGYLTMLNFGMEMYVINHLNRCYTRRQLDEYTRLLHSALALNLVIVLGAIVLVGFLVFVVPLEQWLNFKYTNHLAAAIVAFCLAVQVIASIPFGLVAGLYRTFGELPRGTMVRNFQRLALFGLTAFVLVAGGGLPHVAIAQLLPLIGVTLFVLWDLKRRHPEIRVGLQKSDWRLAFTFIGPSLFFFLIQVSNGFTFQGSTLVVSVVVGSGAVAVFVTLRTLTNLVRQLVGSANNALWPELTSLEARGDFHRLRVAHRLLVKISLAACVCAAIGLHFVGRDVVTLWTGGRIAFNQTLMDLFLIYLVAQVPWLASSLFPAAANRHRNLAICYVLSGGLGLGLAVIFSSHLGLGAVGVVAGLWLADMLVCGWFVPWDTCRMLGERVGKFWTDAVLRGLPVVVIEWIIACWIIQFRGPLPLRILAVFGSVTLVGISVGYLVWLNGEDRKRIASLLVHLWSRVLRAYPKTLMRR